MNPRLALNLTILLAILAGVAAGGWFVGAEFLADQPEAPTTLALDSADDAEAGVEEGAAASVAGRVRVGYDPAAHINTALVLGASGLSPFQPEGLRGRQVLAGRVVEVREEMREVETAAGLADVLFHIITLETSSGRAAVTIRPDSTFLLSLRPGQPSEIGAGAAIALIFEQTADGRATASAALVLPPASRPVLNSGLPPVTPAPSQEADDQAADPEQ